MSQRVVMVLFDGFQLLDLAGPADVFSSAGLLSPAAGYQVETTALREGAVRSSSGVTVVVETPLREVKGPIDTLLVVGGLPTHMDIADTAALTPEVRRLAGESARVGSICSGTLLLAEAGLLKGRKVTTHWAVGNMLAREYPDVRVDADRIYVRDGNVWTSAGVTSGIDLALALVAHDHGHELARDISRWLVVYLQRPGGQSQFSTPLSVRTPKREPLRDLQTWIEENLDDDLSVEVLAGRVNMSVRHFSRVFRTEVGVPPARYVEHARTAAAKRLLESADEPLDRIAVRVGLGTPETLYRVFRRHLTISPGEYRRRFHTKES
ncbi:GlxA family transcriptional regulator [Streptosporangium lutulentum]|uniref:Transcriptional regulator GlxA family with amidase domain n=1 Tax=Streptosporangium lutulentum TaxID=1461250 RepID=A0ABT9QKI6_9ACTN|nr:GlxA family transcriptional regulator [Streptosporangium lutulentum]MDP9847255.1 transcriptional regulator GlxA family with amidase domain [Streptosporangium lutulentum]